MSPELSNYQSVNVSLYVPCTVYSVRCTVYGVRCTVYGVRCTVYGVRCTVYGVRCTVYGVQCTYREILTPVVYVGVCNDIH